ncbi:hypothetical protein [Nonomuraea sp. NPDC050310]|uniref:hypothetical protein n=1 Tax=Nonomuraea sp. NPDC050310 TaxID=3154935 RepID=UPI003401BFEE
MTRLRRALEGIAQETPLVDNLAEGALRGYRRRRRTRRIVASAFTAAVVVAGGVLTAGALRPAAPVEVGSAGVQELPDLPEGAVGPAGRAHLVPCEYDRESKELDCSSSEWRLVTRSGKTYRLPRATAYAGNDRVPVAISRDGRFLAFYDDKAGAHVVRDLVSGPEVVSGVRVELSKVGPGSMLVLSDDGRHLFFDPREGSAAPGLLVDVAGGKSEPVSGVYEAVSIKDGMLQLVRYIKTDHWLRPVSGKSGRPVRFDGAYIMFSEPAPDGARVVAVEHATMAKRVLSVLDAKKGKVLRRLTLDGLPKQGGLAGTGLWLSDSEVTVFFDAGKGGVRAYAVDVRSGRLRLLEKYTGAAELVALPGQAAGDGSF